MTDQTDPNAEYAVEDRAVESRHWDLEVGARIVAAVAADGTEDWWFLDPDASHGVWWVPQHEFTGPLPLGVRARLAARWALFSSHHPDRAER